MGGWVGFGVCAGRFFVAFFMCPEPISLDSGSQEFDSAGRTVFAILEVGFEPHEALESRQVAKRKGGSPSCGFFLAEL